ncbi:glycosyltransferase [Psychrobacter sp.]|uniref:glycosyltransferase n=1 Tax=Psychrobacter sp. TaxID=56811 RepID=UPI0026476D35|nr:glycosyltransferase [Psychrobacter sp.]MDN6307901.1 glycosyltransferase [Psychrobacter sp.]
MKKIVLAIFTLQGNGAERFALTMAKALSDSGHEAHLVYFKDMIELPIPSNINLHFFNYQKYRKIPRSFRSIIASKAFDKFILNHIGEPDLVLSNLYPVDMILAKSTLKNVHLVIHNTLSQEYASTLTPSLVSKLEKTYQSKPCIAVSEGVKQDFIELFGLKSNIQTIHNPIDIEAVKTGADEFIPSHQNYIVHVGKFKAQKRHDILIKAYALANIPQKLVLVGTGNLLAEAKQLVADLEIENDVVFAGFQKNPYPFIKNADLMVVSSDFEGFSIAILEALALETPVISTDCPSGPNEILPPKNLVPVGDIEALATKLQQSTINPTKHFTVLSNDFSPKNTVTKYLQLISHI